jgi:hypothetical protein
MEETNIFSCIKISNFLEKIFNDNVDYEENDNENDEDYINYNNNNDKENSKVIICGKFFTHKLNEKYSFAACDFYLYIPLEKNKLFHSTMKSENCFNSNLKWNENFFMKIRTALNSPYLKTGFFSINYCDKNLNENQETLKDSKNLEGNNIENYNKEINEALMENDIFDDLDLGEDNKIIEKSIFFELKILIDDEFITIFRLELNEVFAENPINTILNRALEYEEIENEMLNNKIRQYEDSQNEFFKLNQQICEKEFLLEKNKREYLYKFYLLNKEKDKKIEELKNLEINKFNEDKKNIKNFEYKYKEKKPIILKELINDNNNNNKKVKINENLNKSEENIYEIFENLD